MLARRALVLSLLLVLLAVPIFGQDIDDSSSNGDGSCEAINTAFLPPGYALGTCTVASGSARVPNGSKCTLAINPGSIDQQQTIQYEIVLSCINGDFEYEYVPIQIDNNGNNGGSNNGGNSNNNGGNGGDDDVDNGGLTGTNNDGGNSNNNGGGGSLTGGSNGGVIGGDNNGGNGGVIPGTGANNNNGGGLSTTAGGNGNVGGGNGQGNNTPPPAGSCPIGVIPTFYNTGTCSGVTLANGQSCQWVGTKGTATEGTVITIVCRNGELQTESATINGVNIGAANTIKASMGLLALVAIVAIMA